MYHLPINGWTKKEIIQAIQLGNKGEKAMTKGVCKYLTANGNKCAVGVFIPEDVYHVSLEKAGSVDNLLREYPGLKAYMPLETAALLELQVWHDHVDESADPRPGLIAWVVRNVVDV